MALKCKLNKLETRADSWFVRDMYLDNAMHPLAHTPVYHQRNLKIDLS